MIGERKARGREEQRIAKEFGWNFVWGKAAGVARGVEIDILGQLGASVRSRLFDGCREGSGPTRTQHSM